MSFFDFIVDLMWGGSEIYLARKKKKDEASDEREEAAGRATRQDGEPTGGEAHEASTSKPADHDEAARIIGNKTV